MIDEEIGESREMTETIDGGFATLGLDPRMLPTLIALGYEEPTPIQREAIPPLLAGRDLLGRAATGTGKTAAFALPMLQRISVPGAAKPSALVLVPTRELAMQVAEAVHKYGRDLGTRVLPVYGGASIEVQLRALKRGVDVIIATPGRALDHIRRRTMSLDGIKFVVLDEADEMLDMGFADDLEAILDAIPGEPQTALFSATMPPRIATIARQHLNDPVQVNIVREASAAGTMPRVRQTAYIVPRAHKLAALGRVLDMEGPTAAIVFCRTRTEVDELTETLNARGYRAEALHGGMSQEARDRVMRRVRDGSADLLVATDVAARGLDIQHLSHVVNYDVPSAPEAYVHRIGRTGRAGREGVAITLAEPREHRLLRNIEQVMGQKIVIASVPTVAELRARRLDITRGALRESLLSDDLDHFRVVVESLAAEFDLMDIATAAVRLAHQALAPADAEEKDIPTASPPRERDRTSRERPARDRPARERSPRDRPTRERSARKPVEWDVTRLYIGAGRMAGVRPGDLVGAIANEVGIDASAIGAIQITEKFSVVEVPEEIADDIIAALKATKIKGKKVLVRRDREA
ncbi:MAG: DEAD/DEAH box helicase [Gemmatimonadota bacterium]|nr:DEAD/DEAH box helicase [Gemmatimonadota bacterium]